MKKALSFLIYTCSLALLPSCATSPKITNQTHIPVDQLNIKNREAIAKEYFNKNDYASALTQWKILRTIAPDNIEYKNRVQIMEMLIKRRTKRYLKVGYEAMQARDYQTAETAFLKILALDPQHTESLDMLKKIKSRRMDKPQQTETKRPKKNKS
ncbi:MAG TPA: hypothetical protein ENK06_11090 [Gammaproteobacteria bacterium]|nr:hypothetical protein [Gammaproteobacteria bacterium]